MMDTLSPRESEIGVLRRQEELIARSCDQAVRLAEERDAARVRRADLAQGRPQWAVAAPQFRAGVPLLAPVAVAGIDMCLFAPVAEFLGATDLRIPAWLPVVAVPLFFVWLDLFLGEKVRLAAARDRDLGTNSRYVVGFMAVLFGLVMPCFVLSIQMAAGEEDTGTWPLLLTAGLIALALVSHGLLILAGEHSLDAAEFVRFRWMLRSVDERLQLLESRMDAARADVRRLYVAYYHRLEAVNRTEPRVSSGPFDERTAQYIDATFRLQPPERASEPTQAGANADPQPAVPPGPGPAAPPTAEPADDQTRDAGRRRRDDPSVASASRPAELDAIRTALEPNPLGVPSDLLDAETRTEERR